MRYNSNPCNVGSIHKPIDPDTHIFEGTSYLFIYSLPEHAMFGIALHVDVVCRFAAGSAGCEGRASETPHYRSLYS